MSNPVIDYISLAPQVILTDYHIEVDPTNVDSAIIIFKAQVSFM